MIISMINTRLKNETIQLIMRYAYLRVTNPGDSFLCKGLNLHGNLKVAYIIHRGSVEDAHMIIASFNLITEHACSIVYILISMEYFF